MIRNFSPQVSCTNGAGKKSAEDSQSPSNGEKTSGERLLEGFSVSKEQLEEEQEEAAHSAAHASAPVVCPEDSQVGDTPPPGQSQPEDETSVVQVSGMEEPKPNGSVPVEMIPDDTQPDSLDSQQLAEHWEDSQTPPHWGKEMRYPGTLDSGDEVGDAPVPASEDGGAPAPLASEGGGVPAESPKPLPSDPVHGPQPKTPSEEELRQLELQEERADLQSDEDELKGRQAFKDRFLISYVSILCISLAILIHCMHIFFALQTLVLVKNIYTLSCVPCLPGQDRKPLFELSNLPDLVYQHLEQDIPELKGEEKAKCKDVVSKLVLQVRSSNPHLLCTHAFEPPI